MQPSGMQLTGQNLRVTIGAIRQGDWPLEGHKPEPIREPSFISSHSSMRTNTKQRNPNAPNQQQQHLRITILAFTLHQALIAVCFPRLHST